MLLVARSVPRPLDTELEQHEPRPHRWTREEYYRLAAAGIIGPEARTELIEGVVLEMSPQTAQHAAAVLRASRVLGVLVGPERHLRPQLPLALGLSSDPEPDVALVTGAEEDYEES